MPVSYEQTLLTPQERVLSTLEADGSRRWLFPRLAPGRFLSNRRAVAYLLIIIFTAIPYIHINGKPAMLLDVVHRSFTFFGLTFLPNDTILLALFMVSVFLGIFFITALFGRVWCGWACPQTVYMEFVYRPIERLFTGRAGVGGRPKDVPGWRGALMYLTFLLVSMYLAHTFLAYFVGVDQLRQWIKASPANHPIAFTVMILTTAAMMFDFAFFREQTCIVACPYGRFQSVLMDRQSLIISYDTKRGEPRGKPGASKGDCIDCSMCVQVCPTGIDIRDGLQLECVGCAQCIDACDQVMDRISHPRGLIRYSSQSAMSGTPQRLLRPRVIIYPAIVIVLLSVLAYLIATKSPLDVTVLRSLGRPFVMTDGGLVENTMRLKLTNRTDRPMKLSFSVVDRPEISVTTTQNVVELRPSQVWMEPIMLIAAPEHFKFGTMDVVLRVTLDDNTTIDRRCRLLGPSATSRPTGGADAKH